MEIDINCCENFNKPIAPYGLSIFNDYLYILGDCEIYKYDKNGTKVFIDEYYGCTMYKNSISLKNLINNYRVFHYIETHFVV